MQFGVCLPNYRGPAAPHNIVQAARKAEELGFDSIWTTDHVVINEPYLETFGPVFYDPLLTLAYVSSLTSRVKLGTTVLILPYRNPIVVAKMLSTLDQLSSGRLIFGVGAGWAELEFNVLNVPFAERGERSDEYLRIIRTLWTEPDPSFHGKFFTFSNLAFEPKPAQAHLPIWIGGLTRRAARRAAEHGDAWHPNPRDLNVLRDGIDHMHRVCERIGRAEPPELTARLNVRLVKSADQASSRENRIGGRRTPEQLAEDVRTLQGYSVTHLVLDFPADSAAELWEAMDIFAQEIRPRVG